MAYSLLKVSVYLLPRCVLFQTAKIVNLSVTLTYSWEKLARTYRKKKNGKGFSGVPAWENNGDKAVREKLPKALKLYQLAKRWRPVKATIYPFWNI